MKILNYKGEKTPTGVMQVLTESASMECMRADCRTMDFDRKTRENHARDVHKIGELTFKHPGPHNEILKALKSSDIQNARWPNGWTTRAGCYFNKRTQKWIDDPNYRASRKRSSVVALPHEKA